MKEKLILSDQTEIEIENSSSLSDTRVISQTKSDMTAIWDKLTEENLKVIQIRNRDGFTISNYENLVLDSETSMLRSDGTILTSFHFRKKTEVELLREEIESLKEGQEVQDGAISDLGTAVSDLAERGLA